MALSDVLASAIVTVPYTSEQIPGVSALAFAGFMSLLAILGIFIAVGVKIFISTDKSVRLYGQTHTAPYFIALLVANMIQSIGSILNINWLSQNGTTFGNTCVAQGITKNVGNVGAALWSMVLAMHAFNVLFLRSNQHKATPFIVVGAVWVLIFMIDLTGPALLQRGNAVPFFGISGYWCWITAEYPHARIFLEYFWMFTSAIACGIIYSMIWLRMRGNLGGSGWRMKFRRIPKSERWAIKLSRDEVDSRLYKLAKQLMLYPLTYVLIVFPIALARFLDFAGMNIPFWFTILADFFFNLNGFFNVIIFVVTMKFAKETISVKLNAPRKSIFATNFGITPFTFPSNQDETELPVGDRDLEKGVVSEEASDRRSVGSVESYQSTNSQEPLTSRAITKV